MVRISPAGAALAAALAVAAGAAGCGSDPEPAAAPPSTAAGQTTSGPAPATGTGTAAPGGSSPAPGTSAPAGTTAAPAAGRCHTSELSLAFGPVRAGAGQRQGTVILQNRSTRRCTLFGYGGLQLLDAARRPLPVTLRRVGTAPTLIRFGPRSDQVSKPISWSAIPSGQGCVQPVYVLVTPPDETDPLTARWPYGPVCGGRIDGSAYGSAAGG
jgi:hypothetical protein